MSSNNSEEVSSSSGSGGIMLHDKVKQLEAQVAKLKTEKFKLASDNLAQAEKIEAMQSQYQRKGSVSSSAEVYLEELVQSTKLLVEEREQQLVKLIDVNHLLSSQIRFLAMHVVDAFDASMGVASTRTHVERVTLQTSLSDKSSDNFAIEHAISIINSLESSAEGTRAELRIAIKEYASAELRISEQQATIESLESRIEGIFAIHISILLWRI